MDTYKLLLEGYLVFGIILTYTIVFIIGVLIGERQAEKERENEQKIQSNKKIPIYGTKFKIME